MKKLFVLFLALCLMLVCPAFAEAPGEITHDFGDFTITYPDTLTAQFNEITDGGVFLTLLENPGDDDAYVNRLSCAWSSGYTDLTAVDPAEYAQTLMADIPALYQAQGVTATTPLLYGSELGEQDGKPALNVIFSFRLDESGANPETAPTIFYLSGIVSDPDLGTYSFTVSTDDINSCFSLLYIMDTVSWQAGLASNC